MTEYIRLPKNAKDITGQRFGRLVALGPVGQADDWQILWLCQCDCGNTSVVKKGHLAPRRTKSCGCANKDRLRRMNTVHGMKHDPLYSAWMGMIQRCTNPSNKDFRHYGGRGIRVCDEWKSGFQTFHKVAARVLPLLRGTGNRRSLLLPNLSTN